MLVKIENMGDEYSGYNTWVKHHFGFEIMKKFDNTDTHPRYDKVYYTVGSKQHLDHAERTLWLIKDLKENYYVFEDQGLRFLTKQTLNLNEGI